MIVTRRFLYLGTLCLLWYPYVAAVPRSDTVNYPQLARTIPQELVEVPSTESGAGSTPAAEAIARHLRAAGFSAEDVQGTGGASCPMKMSAKGRSLAWPDGVARTLVSR